MNRMKQFNVAKIFIITLIIIGIIFGIMYFYMQEDLSKTLIYDKLANISSIIKDSNQKMIVVHLITIVILLFLSYSIIGMPLILFYLFYECTSLGFLIASFYASFSIKGVIFALIYILISKAIYIICLVYICYIALKITKKLLRVLLLKEQESLYTLLKNLFLKLGIALVVIIIYDLFLYFGANKILSFFLFLLK